MGVAMESILELTAKMEPFDSFWEGPENIEKGYKKFYQFYKCNYLLHMPKNREASILVISCGPGYFVNLLTKEGYTNVLGIDSDPEKVRYAKEKNLNCRAEQAFPFVANNPNRFDVIFCEQEINHLTKEEMVAFMKLCHASLRENGTVIIHSLNGANPITGSESLAQNFDHYNTCTEYTLLQLMKYCKFSDIEIRPLKLYVFYKNPLNYVLIVADALFTAFFRLAFIMYGKSNKIFTKKIAAIAKKA
jgi:2-polyprenyl-3-methyl-5-hydroxy-6-metoxy-1,4-benzoquinol methylase